VDSPFRNMTVEDLLIGWSEKRESAPYRNELMKRSRAAGFVLLPDFLMDYFRKKIYSEDASGQSEASTDINKFQRLVDEMQESGWTGMGLKTLPLEVLHGILQRHADNGYDYEDLPDGDQNVVQMAENYYRLWVRAKGMKDKDFIFSRSSGKPMRDNPNKVHEYKQLIAEEESK
jgi:hypothetical protein